MRLDSPILRELAALGVRLALAAAIVFLALSVSGLFLEHVKRRYAAQAAPKTRACTLDVTVSPAEARLKLDGRTLRSGKRAWLRPGRCFKLRVECVGCVSHERVLMSSGGALRLHITLARPVAGDLVKEVLGRGVDCYRVQLPAVRLSGRVAEVGNARVSLSLPPPGEGYRAVLARDLAYLDGEGRLLDALEPGMAVTVTIPPSIAHLFGREVSHHDPGLEGGSGTGRADAPRMQRFVALTSSWGPVECAGIGIERTALGETVGPDGCYAEIPLGRLPDSIAQAWNEARLPPLDRLARRTVHIQKERLPRSAVFDWQGQRVEVRSKGARDGPVVLTVGGRLCP